MIYLLPMTKELCRKYMQKFIVDPVLFKDKTQYKPYVYSEEECDAYFERYKQMGRVHMAIMRNDEPIGELILKKIDYTNKHCTLGISMRSDEFKNKGYGTAAEILALKYAFDKIGMDTVYADTLHNNKRSQHVLRKVGFTETHTDDTFRYYRCKRSTWMPPECAELSHAGF